MCFFLFSYGASQQRPCVRIGLTHAYLSHVKMTLANAKSANRQTLENVVRNAASEFTQRIAIASLASDVDTFARLHTLLACLMEDSQLAPPYTEAAQQLPCIVSDHLSVISSWLGIPWTWYRI